MKIAVVALGKIGLPLAVQFAERGHDVVGVDVNRGRRRPGQRGHASRSRARPSWPRSSPRSVAAGRLRATTDNAEAVAGADAVVVVVPLFVDDEGRARLRLDGRRDRDIAARPDARHARLLRDDAAGRHHPHPVEAAARGGLGARRGQRLPPRLQPRAGADRPGVRRPAQVPEAGRRHRRRRGARRGRRVLRGGARVRRAARPDRGPTGSGTSAAPRPPRWPSSPRPPTGTSTSGWPTSSRGSPARTASTSRRSSRRATPSRTATSTGPGIAVGGHCIPVYPRLYLWNDPDATVVRAAREANAAMPELRRGRCSRRALRRPGRARRGGARRGLPRRGEGDGVLRGVRHGRGAARPGRRRASCTTRCTPTTSWRRSAACPPPRRAGRRGRHPGRPRRVPRARPPPTCPGCRRSSTAAGSPTRPRGRA